MYLNGSSYLKLVNPFVFSGQDFTIATEINFSEKPSRSEPCIWQLYGGGSYRVQLEFYDTGRLWLWANGDNVDIDSSDVLIDSQTHHVEVDYSNSVWYLFLDGQLVGTDTYTLPNGNLPLYIGVNNRSNARIDGLLDNFIFYDGSALHTTNFIPPTAADYSNLARQIAGVFEFDFADEYDTSRKIKNDIHFNLDTIRKNAVPVQLQLDTLRDLPFILKLDTKKITANNLSFNLDTLRKINGILDFQADLDTERKIINAVEFSADTNLQVIQSVELGLDAERIVERTVNFNCDTQRKLPYPFIVSPTYNLLPINTPVTAGIQSLNINITAGALIDQFNFVTVNQINMLEQIKGQYLDYKFNFRVEHTSERDIFTDLPVTTCQCCSDIDELLYTQRIYNVQRTNWNGGTYAKNNNTDTSQTPIKAGQTRITYRNNTEVIETKHAFASSHIRYLASAMGKTPVFLFDDFISTVDLEQDGVTYQDLIEEIFGWSKRVPHKLINVFLRDDKLFVIERGHEQNTYNLDDLDISQIGSNVNVDKSLVRTSFGVTTEVIADLEKGKSLNDGYWEPVLGNPFPEDGDDDDDDADEDYEDDEEPEKNLPSSVITEENGVITEITYEYDDDGNLTKTTTITISDIFASKVEVFNTYTTRNNGEKLLSEELTVEYEYDSDSGNWEVVDRKVVYHTYTTVGQQHVTSVSSDGSVNVSATTNASDNDKPTPFQKKNNSQNDQNYIVEQNGFPFVGNGWGLYTYVNGQKIEIVGFQKNPDTVESETGTLEQVKLYDSSFPVSNSKKAAINSQMKWLNRKIQEIVSLAVYDFPHVFDCNDKIIFRGNTYHLQSNSVTHSDGIINQQSLQLIRWYSQGNTTGKKWELVST